MSRDTLAADDVLVSGHAFLESHCGASRQRQVNAIALTIGELVRYETRGVGTDRTAVVESRSPHVRAFLRRVDAANRLAGGAPSPAARPDTRNPEQFG